MHGSSGETQAVLGEILDERGIEPSEVAARVVQAVRSDRFWIFTHDVTLGTAMRRFDELKADRNPTPVD